MGVLRQVESGFSSFFVKFFAYLMIFQRKYYAEACCETLKNYQIYIKNLAKNEEKAYSSELKPISPRHFESTQVQGVQFENALF